MREEKRCQGQAERLKVNGLNGRVFMIVFFKMFATIHAGCNLTVCVILFFVMTMVLHADFLSPTPMTQDGIVNH